MEKIIEKEKTEKTEKTTKKVKKVTEISRSKNGKTRMLAIICDDGFAATRHQHRPFTDHTAIEI